MTQNGIKAAKSKDSYEALLFAIALHNKLNINVFLLIKICFVDIVVICRTHLSRFVYIYDFI